MEPQVDIRLCLEDVNKILTALAEQPARISMELILEIRSQVGPQVQPPPTEPEEAP